MDEMKTYFSNASKEKVYFWEYDDRSVTSLRFDTGCKDAREMKTFATLEKMRAYFNSGKKEEIQFKRCKIPCGIDRQKHRVFSSVNPDKTVLEECFAELEKMIAAHSKNKDNTAMLSLFSWAMAGYISRLLISKMETPPLYFYRAPIIQIVGHKNDACLGFEYLQRIIESLYVDTSWSSKAVLNNPAVIPAYRSVDKIVDCAYLVMNKDQKKTPCDTQYRDTMVLLHPHFFEKEQCNKFINRNVWASIFLFNKKPDQSSTAIQRVDMNDMALPEWTWSPEKVNTLITGYVNWLSYIPCSAEYKRRWRFWNIAGEQILYYSELAGAAKGKRKLQGCEREYKLLQIKAIIALLDYCYITDVIDLDRQAQLVQNWIGGLFPGYPYQQLNLKKAEKQSDNETQENTRLLNE